MKKNSDVWDIDTPVEESPYNWRGEPKLIKRNLNKNPLPVVDLFCGAGGFESPTY